MGITRDGMLKRRATGGKRPQFVKKRKFNLARPSAATKIGSKRIHSVRTRGGNTKFRALRLEAGSFSWGSEAITRKCRVLDVVYNASNNELVRTKTLVKNSIISIDAHPLKQYYESHYGVSIGQKKGKGKKSKDGEADQPKKSSRVLRKLASRQKDRSLEEALDAQFQGGRLLACISSRPGQSGRVDGYVLEGKELEFYTKKINARKAKSKQ
mmetsp:Transcript_24697/g.74121  ORF Transcript_24697/g.74121 Transcript_24697/m.74121 type:complete len:212 (+) Transcript_24697:65-700(+)|eukprot:CAMPEP_0119271938 /NCGR_PEP_ID=MMETSP1329-20130426/8321_1 /TAXON_ID=114041 /ORGANISM="Genus nov. species nov., Strain RCC1024" /LENGTH=211 /DNA_ID=CAMNT_0007271997 /DNA_START=112 /DNA_END=747 /DNA_ORIENTATION=-